MGETLYDFFERIANETQNKNDKYVLDQVAKRFKALDWYTIDHIPFKDNQNLNTQAENLLYKNIKEYSGVMRLDSIVINSMVEFTEITKHLDEENEGIS